MATKPKKSASKSPKKPERNKQKLFNSFSALSKSKRIKVSSLLELERQAWLESELKQQAPEVDSQPQDRLRDIQLKQEFPYQNYQDHDELMSWKSVPSIDSLNSRLFTSYAKDYLDTDELESEDAIHPNPGITGLEHMEVISEDTALDPERKALIQAHKNQIEQDDRARKQRHKKRKVSLNPQDQRRYPDTDDEKLQAQFREANLVKGLRLQKIPVFPMAVEGSREAEDGFYQELDPDQALEIIPPNHDQEFIAQLAEQKLDVRFKNTRLFVGDAGAELDAESNSQTLQSEDDDFTATTSTSTTSTTNPKLNPVQRQAAEFYERLRNAFNREPGSQAALEAKQQLEQNPELLQFNPGYNFKRPKLAQADRSLKQLYGIA